MSAKQPGSADWLTTIAAAEARVRARPNPIPSYYENWVLRQRDSTDAEVHAQLARHAARQADGRFVAWPVRRAVALDGLDPQRRSEIPSAVLRMSQGADAVLQWRGRELFKNVFDFALLPMLLRDLRPTTILELGSGNGSSACWLADLATINTIDCAILSVDVAPVRMECPGVTFVRGDCRDLTTLPGDWSAHGPRLVLEDAHVGVGEALAYVDARLARGDYVVVEDSVSKADTIGAFLAERPGRYAVDTYYTDFFGRNATSCVDSILVRLA